MVEVAAACIAFAVVAAGPSAAATRPAASGHTYGGVTPQDWPIVVDLNKDRTKITRIVIGLDMTCTSNENFGTTDGFKNVKFNSESAFKASSGPERIDAAGTPADIQSSITGARSKDRSKITGTWSYKVTFYDAAGTTVTDTCESGVVTWKATQ